MDKETLIQFIETNQRMPMQNNSVDERRLYQFFRQIKSDPDVHELYLKYGNRRGKKTGTKNKESSNKDVLVGIQLAESGGIGF